MEVIRNMVCAKFYSENLKARQNLGHLFIDEMIINRRTKMDLKKIGCVLVGWM
jgi:hypothetical protein